MRRLLVALSVVLVAGLAPAPVATAQSADREFTFYGSGFGHGLGMSQWGAYGLSREGWKANRILTHFYSGTAVDKPGSAPERLRIGLVQGRRVVQLEAQNGVVELRLGDRANGDLVGTIPSGETWRVRSANGAYRILDHGGAKVATVGDASTPMFAVYQSAGARVRVPEALHTYNRGWIEFGLYSCDPQCAMRLVLEVATEEYLYGLAEVPSSWPMPALQAQAIAARTYAVSKAAQSQHRSGCDCALYATSADQVYAGWDKEGATDGDRWVAAVDATAGRVVTNGGETIQAFYMSSSGGHTEDNENVWGGAPIDYLRGVCDPGDYTTANPSATWEVTFSAAEVTSKLGLGIGTVTGFGNAARGTSGRIVSIVVNGENGSTTIAGTDLRSRLGLRDDRVWIDQNRQIVGEIREKYDTLGCSPGLPRSRQTPVAGGARQRFARGTIFFEAAPGAHELHGPVLTAYQDRGGPGGALGFPTSDVRRRQNGNLWATFEHGRIVCAGTSCRVRTS
jgi:SpoIID/LytB domain protein